MPTIQCQFCGCDLVENLVLCQDCSTPHHEDCFRCNGICTTYACGCTTFVQAEDGATIELPAIDTGAKNAVLNKSEKAVVTPTDIPVIHHYHRELSIHRFIYDAPSIEPAMGRRGQVIFFAIMLLIALINPDTAKALSIYAGFFVLCASTSGTSSRGEIVINKDNLIFSPNRYVEYIGHKKQDNNDDEEDMRRRSRFIYTVDRKEIESIRMVDTLDKDGTKVIRIEAEGRIRSFNVAEEKSKYVDSVEIGPWIDQRGLHWLMLCIEHLATVKKM